MPRSVSIVLQDKNIESQFRKATLPRLGCFSIGPAEGCVLTFTEDSVYPGGEMNWGMKTRCFTGERALFCFH